MTGLLAALLALHGAIHLMGPAKAFRYAELPNLTQPISPAMGAVWLLAALLMLATAAALFVWPRWWWMVGAAALVLSQVAIMGSWGDAKFGTVPNLILAAGVLFGLLTYGPGSLRARYDADVDRGLARFVAAGVVEDRDLAHLPDPVQRYLRRAGVVGRPKVQNVRVRMHGRIRSSPDAPWMPFASEQVDFFDEPSRFFYMNASRMALPIQGLHRFADSEATMRVKLAALIPVATAGGVDMTRAETVTLFNDMCLFAPATLIDPAITWRAIDDTHAAATFRHAGHAIDAELTFTNTGELVDFRSDDRQQLGADGSSMRPLPWSTPMDHHQEFRGHHLGSHGEGRWHEPDGSWAYIELFVDDVEFNVTTR